MSWPAFAARLSKLRPLLAGPAPSFQAAVDLERRCCELTQLATNCASQPSPTGSRRSSLIEALKDTAACLEALDLPLAMCLQQPSSDQHYDAGETATVNLIAGAALVHACAVAGSGLGLASADARAIARAAQLLFGSGAAALRLAVAARAGAATAHGPEPFLLRVQVGAMVHLVQLQRAAHSPQLHPAADLAAWMAAAAACLSSLGPDRGSDPTPALSPCLRLLLDTLAAAFYQADHQYTQAFRTAELSRALVDLLLPRLPAMSAAMAAVIASTDPAQHELGWEAVWRCAQVLCSEVACPALRQRFAAADCSTRLHLLQHAASLVRRLPAAQCGSAGLSSASASASTASQVWVGRLLGVLCTVTSQQAWMERHAGSRQVTTQYQLQQQAAAALLPTVAHLQMGLRNTLARAQDAQQLSHAAMWSESLNNTLSSLFVFCDTDAGAAHRGSSNASSPAASIQAAPSLEDIPTWCATACEALAALPVLALFEALAAGAPHMACIAVFPVERILGFADRVGCMCGTLAGEYPAGEQLDAAAAAAVMDSLWQLHTAACRLCHWANGGASAAGVCSRNSGRAGIAAGLAELHSLHLSVVCRVFTAACAMHDLVSKCGHTFEHDAAVGPARFSTVLHAMSAANWEAMALLVPSEVAGGLGGPDVRCLQIQGCLISVYGTGEAGLLVTPGLRRVLVQAMQLGNQVDPMARAQFHRILLAIASAVPRLAAALLEDGVVDALLADLAGDYQQPMPEDVVKEIAGQVWQLLAAVLGAAACLDARLAAEPELAGRPEQQLLAAELTAAWEEVHMHNTKEPGVPSHRSGGIQAPSFDLLRAALPAMLRLATVLQKLWQPEQQVQAAQAAAARSCTYLRCANLASSLGGPRAGQGRSSMRCGRCRAVWYCGTSCSHPDWCEGGHRRACAALGAARAAERGSQAVVPSC